MWSERELPAFSAPKFHRRIFTSQSSSSTIFPCPCTAIDGYRAGPQCSSMSAAFLAAPAQGIDFISSVSLAPQLNESQVSISQLSSARPGVMIPQLLLFPTESSLKKTTLSGRLSQGACYLPVPSSDLTTCLDLLVLVGEADADQPLRSLPSHGDRWLHHGSAMFSSTGPIVHDKDARLATPAP